MTSPAPAPASRWLVTTAVLLLAINLRPVVNALGAVIPELRAATGLPAATTGVLLSLPTLAFAVMGLAAPVLAARLGSHRTVVIALLALIAGQVIRSVIPGTAALFIGSLVGLAGIAVGNVLLPGLVRLHFPDRIPLMTAAYTTLLTIGGAAAAAATLPIERAVGGDWRTGLGMWAGVAVVALIPWLILIRSRAASGPAPTAGRRLPLSALARTRVAWALAVYFGCQSMVAYVVFGWLSQILTDEGMSDTAAAAQVGIAIAVGIPLAALVPPLLGRISRPAVAGDRALGLLPGRVRRAVVRATGVRLGAVGADRHRHRGVPAGADADRARARGRRWRPPRCRPSPSAVGYLIASVGPFGFGILYDLSGGWTVPLLALCAVVVLQAVAGCLAVRPRFVEDELPAAAGPDAAVICGQP